MGLSVAGGAEGDCAFTASAFGNYVVAVPRFITAFEAGFSFQARISEALWIPRRGAYEKRCYAGVLGVWAACG